MVGDKVTITLAIEALKQAWLARCQAAATLHLSWRKVARRLAIRIVVLPRDWWDGGGTCRWLALRCGHDHRGCAGDVSCLAFILVL